MKVGQHPVDDEAAECVRRENAQNAGRFVGEIFRREFGLVDQRQALRGAIIHLAPGVGDDKPARRAAKKRRAEAMFEVLHLPACRGRRDAELPGGGDETAAFDDADKCNKVIKLLHFYCSVFQFPPSVRFAIEGRLAISLSYFVVKTLDGARAWRPGFAEPSGGIRSCAPASMARPHHQTSFLFQKWRGFNRLSNCSALAHRDGGAAD
ncbi:hypothetical protein MPC1_11440002 [Methylocella tundrae]|nr:hypothetical protein MPC1_11440002 [Methylocella tundrae]